MIEMERENVDLENPQYSNNVSGETVYETFEYELLPFPEAEDSMRRWLSDQISGPKR